MNCNLDQEKGLKTQQTKSENIYNLFRKKIETLDIIKTRNKQKSKL